MKFSTYTGKIIDLKYFDAAMVTVEDIAHHLTKECRFGGAMELHQHYSVAQHSIEILMYMYENGERDVATLQYTLLHDASETYLKDLPPYVKELCPDYVRLEKRVQKVIIEKYIGVYCPFLMKRIKDIDKRIVIDEARAFNTRALVLFTEENGCQEKALGIDVKERPLEIIKEIYLNWGRVLNIHDE